ELSERIADIEAAHAPRFVCRTVLDGQASIPHPPQRFIQIINLDREMRDWRPGTAFTCDAHLRCHTRWGLERGNPAEIHNDRQAENFRIELPRAGNVGSDKIRDNALHDHDGTFGTTGPGRQVSYGSAARPL